jgi:hypothetical protein
MREMAHDFAEKEIRPVAWDYDRDATWPQDIIEQAAIRCSPPTPSASPPTRR